MRALVIILVVCGVNINIQGWTGGSLLVALERVGVVVCPRNAPCGTEANQPVFSIIHLQG